MMVIYKFKNVNEQWKYYKNLYKTTLLKSNKKGNKKSLLKEEKFVSFFRHSLLPRKLVEKFPILIENTKKEYLTGNFRYFLTPKNKVALEILMRGFFMIYLTLLYGYRFLDIIEKLKIPQIHDISIFNYFNNNYFNVYYFNNKLLQKIVKGYMLDITYNDTYINYFNLYLFHNLKLLNVLLNFEDFKYEEDQYLLLNKPEKLSIKNKKAWKMKTDFFDYIKKKNRYRLFNKYIKNWPFYKDAKWNQVELGDDDEINIKIKREKKILKDHLMLQDNIFNCYINYEFSLNLINNKILFNYFNIDFFNKVKIFWKKPMKNINKYPFFLKSLYYNYHIIYSNKNKKSFKPYITYKDMNTNKIYNKEIFDPKKHILDVKYFGIKMPFLFFLLYTWYSIYFRRFKYNLYIRGEIFFQEHFSKLNYFVWSNNPGKVGDNRYKLTQFKYQKLFTIHHLKNYLEMKWFNNWFFFYSSYNFKLDTYINLNDNQHKFSFLLLLKNPYILKILNVNTINRKNYMTIFYDFFLEFHYWYELWNGYILFMNTPVTKYDDEFKLGLISYWQFDLMIERIFTMPSDRKLLLQYLQIQILFEHFFNIYLNLNYFNMYFLQDLYNLKLLNDYNKYVKIINFYDKIFYVFFLLIDPYFFKYYWRRCFPRKWHKIRYIQYYILANIVMTQHRIYDLNIPKFNFLMYFFYWRIDSSNHCLINEYNSIKIGYNFIVIDLIYKARFNELLKQINFILKKKYYKNLKYYFSYYLSILRNYYFNMLYYNLEYSLIFFFINKKKYINLLLNNKFNFFNDFLYSNFIYRYYILNILLDTHHYDDWFHDWNKRIFWIYKNFLNHEGILFYNKNTLLTNKY